VIVAKPVTNGMNANRSREQRGMLTDIIRLAAKLSIATNAFYLVVIRSVFGLAYLIAPGNVGAQVTILYSFGGGKPAEGVHPNGDLVLGRDGSSMVQPRKNLIPKPGDFPQAQFSDLTPRPAGLPT
jgi:hypothetical protein